MTDERNREQKKSIGERAEELWQDVLDALESLVNPEPQLVPVRVKSPRYPYPRRRR